MESISSSQLYRRLSSLDVNVLNIVDASVVTTVTWINQSFENPQGVKYASKGPVGAAKKKTKHEYYYIQKEDDDGKVYHFLSNIPNLERNESLSFEGVVDLYGLIKTKIK